MPLSDQESEREGMARTANLSFPCTEQILGVQHCLKADLDFSQIHRTFFILGQVFLLFAKRPSKEQMLLSPPILPFVTCALIPPPAATELCPSLGFGCTLLTWTTFE